MLWTRSKLRKSGVYWGHCRTFNTNILTPPLSSGGCRVPDTEPGLTPAVQLLSRLVREDSLSPRVSPLGPLAALGPMPLTLSFLPQEDDFPILLGGGLRGSLPGRPHDDTGLPQGLRQTAAIEVGGDNCWNTRLDFLYYSHQSSNSESHKNFGVSFGS